MGARLADAVSPYLRAHSGNPVDWFPWGDAAFAEARRRDVPVLISIGYATCHWCHVMARESFSDALTAHELNAHFVAIKVDREEHPDVDSSYLAAASAFTRELGWPLTVFATPDGRAFYAGTYFPPLPQRGMPSFRQVIAAVGEAWRERRGQLEETASAVAAALAEASLAQTAGPLPGDAELAAAVAALAADEDRVHGGFGRAPKFPIAPVLGFLAQREGEGRALARRTLLAMAASPLRDGVDGGFFRYATRSDWSDPHYERMLTDNALLLDVAAELARGEGDDDEVVAVGRGIAGYLVETLQLPEGGFASAQDSESMVDGVRTEGGYATADPERRRTLEPPPLDEKVLTGWNGLAVGALARAWGALDAPDALLAARRAAEFVLAEHLAPDGTVRRASRDGVVSSARAALEDVGMLADGLLDLAVATGAVEDAVIARALIDASLDAAVERAAVEQAAAGAADPATEPAVFAVPGGADPVLAERGLALPTDPAEGAAPSGITACATAAWKLWLLGAGDRYREAAEEAMRRLAGAALERPIAFGAALELMTRFAAPVVQLVVVVPERDGTGRPRGDDGLVRAARAAEASMTLLVTEAEAAAFADAGFELLAGRRLLDGQAAAYRCREFVCALPVADAAALDALAP
ncbi:thioredoxin domain-containing protein [Agromyces sp. NPDC057679]|uniref:thioredoxin domain-containing protein n=1 Tax=Agromyces sp. NPDC057679 TaxID=3346207 RepID=UPI00366C8E7D